MNGEPSRELETRRVNRATKRVYQVIHTVIQNIILAIRKGTATGRDNMNEQEIFNGVESNWKRRDVDDIGRDKKQGCMVHSAT